MSVVFDALGWYRQLGVRRFGGVGRQVRLARLEDFYARLRLRRLAEGGHPAADAFTGSSLSTAPAWP